MIVIVLGLGAAALFAVAAWLQQRAAHAAAHANGEPASVMSSLTGIAPLMNTLLRSRTWLLGWVTNVGGFATQAAALHLGSVAAVQPLMSTQLLFALPLSSREQRSWPRVRDWIAGGLITAGIVVFLVVYGGAPLEGEARRMRVILACVSATALIGLLLLASRYVSTRTASLLVAVGAGLCFALTAVLIKLTTEDLLDRGIAATAVDWPGYALAASTLGGLLLEQVAFAAGPLPWAVAAMSVTNPVASVAIGILAFSVSFPDDVLSLLGLSVSGFLIVLGISGLAHSPLVSMMYAHDEQEVERG